MSANFTGVTFAKQKVTPSYDGIVRRAMLTDGTLTGCEMSYSGSTLTMAAGQLMICGRQIVHPSSQNWAVIEQTSGYARLVITVDLTRTSTKETFDQVVDSIQYATSVDGFASLEQTDINTTGTKYQVEACVVSLGTGGITGIVSKLEKCEGGGAGLNFKVVGGTTTPGSPTENTIWVNTDVAIPSWAFSATEPGSPVAGMVWFFTGTSSTAEFNALKKNDIQVYPSRANQYLGGRWVCVDAYIYKGEDWVQFSQKMLRLYNNGDECTATTGGWTTDGFSYGGTKLEPTKITKDADRIIIKSVTAGDAVSIVGCNRAINLDGYSTLVVVHKNANIISGQGIAADVATSKDMHTDRVAVGFSDASVGNKSTLRLDISSLSGNHYIALHGSANRGGEVYEVFLE